MLSCVFHLANGLWTMGITWGVWTSPAAQRRALWACVRVRRAAGRRGHWARSTACEPPATATALEKAREIENRMYEHRVEAGEIDAERTQTGSVTNRTNRSRNEHLTTIAMKCLTQRRRVAEKDTDTNQTSRFITRYILSLAFLCISASLRETYSDIS